MGGVSIWQLSAITVIVVPPFGTRKPGSIGSGLGASIKDFGKVTSGDEPKQDKTSRGTDFTAEIIADKQADTSQGQAKAEDTKRHDKGQVQSMSDIGSNEPLLVFIIGLAVPGPQRLLVAVKTVADWIRILCPLATTVQNELTQELKLQESWDSLKKVEETSFTNLISELKASVDELRRAAELVKCSYVANDPEKASDEVHIIYNLVMRDSEAAHEGIMLVAA